MNTTAPATQFWEDAIAYFLPNICPIGNFTAFYEGKKDENALYRIERLKLRHSIFFEFNSLNIHISQKHDRIGIIIQKQVEDTILLNCTIKNMDQLLNILDIFI